MPHEKGLGLICCSGRIICQHWFIVYKVVTRPQASTNHPDALAPKAGIVVRRCQGTLAPKRRLSMQDGTPYKQYVLQLYSMSRGTTQSLMFPFPNFVTNLSA